MSELASIAVIAAISAFIISAGKFVDALLLTRHVAWLDRLSLAAWVFLADLKVKDVPGTGIKLFLRAKNAALGEQIGVGFLVRAFAISAVLTLIIFFPVRGLTLFLQANCGQDALSIKEAMTAAVSYRSSLKLPQLVFLNFVFDFATVFATITILKLAVDNNRFLVLPVVTTDIVVCLFLWATVMIVSEKFDSLMTVFFLNDPDKSVFAGIRDLLGYWSSPDCLRIYNFGTRSLLGATVIIPTLAYLTAILVIFFLVEGLRLSRWIGLHILERSVEDEKKSIIGHVSTSLALVVLVFGTLSEIQSGSDRRAKKSSCSTEDANCSGAVVLLNEKNSIQCYRFFDYPAGKTSDFCLETGEAKSLDVDFEDGISCHVANGPPAQCDEFYIQTGIDTECSCK